MGSINLATISVIDVNKARPDSYLEETRQEEQLVDVEQDVKGTTVHMDTNTLKVDFKRHDTEQSRLTVDASGAELKLDASFNGSHESMYWVQPLADDKLSEFHTWKRAGIALEPFTYTFKGKEFSCGEKECFMM